MKNKKTIQEVFEYVSECSNTIQNYEEYQNIIRLGVMKLNSQNIFNQEIQVRRYYAEKVCEICRDFKNPDEILLCDYCEDGFHSYCLKPKVEIQKVESNWYCNYCRIQKSQQLNQQTLEQAFIKDQKCQVCQKKLTKNHKQHCCIQCHLKFHQACFSKSGMVCQQCSHKIQNFLPKDEKSIEKYIRDVSPVNKVKRDNSQTRITEYYGNQKQMIKQIQGRNASKSQNESKQTKITQYICNFQSDEDSQTILIQAKERLNPKKVAQFSELKFKLFKLSKNPQEIIRQKQSIIFALKTQNIAFSDDLVYQNNEHLNNTKDEIGLQKPNKKNYETIVKFKELTNKMNYPSLIIEQHELQGFIIRSTDGIKAMTLICEYSGEVFTANEQLFSKNDSIMDLLRTARSKTSLVIVPQRYSNIGKYISGINNKLDLKTKQNVSTIKLDIDNQARVFMYACRNIKKGEILYQDYNGGGFGEYPTQDFI